MDSFLQLTGTLTVLAFLAGIVLLIINFFKEKYITIDTKLAVAQLSFIVIGVIALITFGCLFLTAFNEKEFHVSQPVSLEIQGAPRIQPEQVFNMEEVAPYKAVIKHADMSVVHDSDRYNVQGTQRIWKPTNKKD